jgi:hypothetical protein
MSAADRAKVVGFMAVCDQCSLIFLATEIQPHCPTCGSPSAVGDAIWQDQTTANTAPLNLDRATMEDLEAQEWARRRDRLALSKEIRERVDRLRKARMTVGMLRRKLSRLPAGLFVVALGWDYDDGGDGHVRSVERDGDTVYLSQELPREAE